MSKYLLRFYRLYQSVGIKEAFLDVLNRLIKKCSYKKRYYRFLNNYPYPICARFDTSDYSVFRQVFIEKGYSCMDDVKNPGLIIDCGANVGYASLYFLNKFKDAYVIAVEPDRENFDVSRRNLSFYNDRVSLIHSAVWTHPTDLVVDNTNEKNAEWAIEVRECRVGEKPDIHSIDIYALLKGSSFQEIDILKIDIEKAEAVIFLKDYRVWLDKVKNIAIELHNQKCEEIFFEAMSNYRFNLLKSGELTVCKNILLKN